MDIVGVYLLECYLLFSHTKTKEPVLPVKRTRLGSQLVVMIGKGFLKTKSLKMIIKESP